MEIALAQQSERLALSRSQTIIRRRAKRELCCCWICVWGGENKEWQASKQHSLTRALLPQTDRQASSSRREEERQTTRTNFLGRFLHNFFSVPTTQNIDQTRSCHRARTMQQNPVGPVLATAPFYHLPGLKFLWICVDKIEKLLFFLCITFSPAAADAMLGNRLSSRQTDTDRERERDEILAALPSFFPPPCCRSKDSKKQRNSKINWLRNANHAPEPVFFEHLSRS